MEQLTEWSLPATEVCSLNLSNGSLWTVTFLLTAMETQKEAQEWSIKFYCFCIGSWAIYRRNDVYSGSCQQKPNRSFANLSMFSSSDVTLGPSLRRWTHCRCYFPENKSSGQKLNRPPSASSPWKQRAIDLRWAQVAKNSVPDYCSYVEKGAVTLS